MLKQVKAFGGGLTQFGPPTSLGHLDGPDPTRTGKTLQARLLPLVNSFLTSPPFAVDDKPRAKRD